MIKQKKTSSTAGCQVRHRLWYTLPAIIVSGDTPTKKKKPTKDETNRWREKGGLGGGGGETGTDAVIGKPPQPPTPPPPQHPNTKHKKRGTY